jgi:hypothetical protein
LKIEGVEWVPIYWERRRLEVDFLSTTDWTEGVKVVTHVYTLSP